MEKNDGTIPQPPESHWEFLRQQEAAEKAAAGGQGEGGGQGEPGPSEPPGEAAPEENADSKNLDTYDVALEEMQSHWGSETEARLSRVQNFARQVFSGREELFERVKDSIGNDVEALILFDELAQRFEANENRPDGIVDPAAEKEAIALMRSEAYRKKEPKTLAEAERLFKSSTGGR
ncbi:MAG: hypothetical protein HY695_30470 [Deltaproteobacteria bacterium]|nr:hypothetical protein [Deltaproteobacteria bacterium]